MNTLEKILNYFNDNEDIFNDCIEELDDNNGYLGDDRYYDMELLQEFYSGGDVMNILQRAYFGRDDDSRFTDSSGNKIYRSFNPNRDYFYYNGYGNLVSSNYKDYSAHLDDYFIEQLVNYRSEIWTVSQHQELNSLLDELESEDGGH